MRVTKYLLTALTVILLAYVDSAFAYVKAQCAFGPRVMNSAAHDSCGDYIVSQFKKYGGEVYEQFADLKLYDGTPIKNRNIIASFNKDAQRRIIICSHWDSRPWADHDPDEANHHTPIDGANDGASGVGVLLELPAAWVCCWSWHGYSPRPLLQWVWTSSALMPKMLELQNGTSRATTLRAHGALVRSIGQASITSRAMWLIMRFCSTW